VDGIKVGEVYPSNFHGDFEVIHITDSRIIKVRFLETGEFGYPSAGAIRLGKVAPYKPTQCGKTKKCTSCEENKPLEDFHKTPRGRGGRRSKCKSCVKSYMTEYRQSNLEKVREQVRINSQKYRDNHVDEFCKTGDEDE